MLKKTVSAITFLIMASLAVAGQEGNHGSTTNMTAEREIKALREEMLEAGRRKDRAAFERLLADDFTFIHSTGGIETKPQYIDHAVSGTQLFQRADVETLAETINVYGGDTAIWTSHSVMRNREDKSEIILRSINVFVKKDERWQWAAGQSTRLPSRPQATAIDHKLYKEYVGQYDAGKGRTLTVTQEGDSLKALVTGFRPAELIPQTATEFVWFNPELNVYSQVIFSSAADGHVTQAAFRREGHEVWRAQKVK